MMRLFVAIELDAAVRERLAGMIERMRAMGAVGNFSRVENLHLTLAFLGETARGGAAGAAMRQVHHPPFFLTLSSLGRFKRSSGGDIWWAGIERSDALLSVQHALCGQLEKAGFAIDKKPFRAHITLAREVRLPAGAVQKLLQIPIEPVSFPVYHLTLMRSHRVAGVLRYTPILQSELT